MKIAAAEGTFLRSAAWRALPATDRVERYLSALGITDVDSWESAEKIVARLKRRHRSEWAALERVFERRGEGDCSDDLYSLKNTSLDLSLGVGALHSGRVHRVFLSHFAPAGTPRLILDVGCENGLVACYYALLFPEAEIEGIDPGTKGIDRARELASLLDLSNARFAVGSLETLSADISARKFDLIITTTLFQDCGLIPNHADDREKAGFVSPRPIEALPQLQALRQILTPNGEWVSLERCRYPCELGWWLETATASAWAIDWTRSERVDCADGPSPNDLTLVVFRPGVENVAPDAQRIRALWLSARFSRGEEVRGAGPWIFSDEAARTCLEFINPKVLERGAKATGCEYWEVREIWTAGPFALFFGDNVAGAAFLRWSVLTNLPALVAEWEAAAGELRARMGEEDVLIYGAIVDQPPPSEK